MFKPGDQILIRAVVLSVDSGTDGDEPRVHAQLPDGSIRTIYGCVWVPSGSVILEPQAEVATP